MVYPYTRRLARDYAAVRCRIMNRPLHYVVDPDPEEPVFIVQVGEEIRELDPEVKVYTEDGQEVLPTGRFFVTNRTINPYHAILDIWDFSAIR